MNDQDQLDQRYNEGQRAAWSRMLIHCKGELGYGAPDSRSVEAFIIEREAAIAQLRSLCEAFGDNGWEPSLHLADIIEKHLGRHLHANAVVPGCR